MQRHVSVLDFTLLKYYLNNQTKSFLKQLAQAIVVKTIPNISCIHFLLFISSVPELLCQKKQRMTRIQLFLICFVHHLLHLVFVYCGYLHAPNYHNLCFLAYVIFHCAVTEVPIDLTLKQKDAGISMI